MSRWHKREQEQARCQYFPPETEDPTLGALSSEKERVMEDNKSITVELPKRRSKSTTPSTNDNNYRVR